MTGYGEDMDATFKQIGGVWLSQQGKASIGTGSITVDGRKVKIVVLPNKRKTETKHPDWILKANVPNDMNMGFSPDTQSAPSPQEPSDAQE